MTTQIQLTEEEIETVMRKRLADLEGKQVEAWEVYTAKKAEIEAITKPYTDQLEEKMKAWSDIYNEITWLKKRLGLPLA